MGYLFPFALRLGVPFHVVVSGRLSPWWSQMTTNLLSGPSFCVYSFSSQPLRISPDYMQTSVIVNDFDPPCNMVKPPA
jgi:hypothetical protein